MSNNRARTLGDAISRAEVITVTSKLAIGVISNQITKEEAFKMAQEAGRIDEEGTLHHGLRGDGWTLDRAKGANGRIDMSAPLTLTFRGR